jgi:hypothetical protein
VSAWPITTSADDRQRFPGEQSRAHVAGDAAAGPRPPRPAARPRPLGQQHHADCRSGDADCDGDDVRPHRRRQGEQDGEREQRLDDLSGGALPGDGAQAAADVAGVPAVANAAVHVADDSAGQRQVEEDRSVVGGHGRGQLQVDAEAAGDDRPAPGAADRGDEADAEADRQQAGVDGVEAVAERPGAQPPDDRRKHGGRAREPHPAPAPQAHAASPSRGSASRSAWPTVTASRPASAAARRPRA